MNDFIPPPPWSISEEDLQQGIHRAVTVIEQLIKGLGPGRHSITCAVIHPEGMSRASVEVNAASHGARSIDGPMSTVILDLAQAFATGRSSGVVVRTRGADGHRDIARGWAVPEGWLVPLASEQLERAYATDPATGHPLPYDPRTVYESAFPLPGAGPGEPFHADREGEG